MKPEQRRTCFLSYTTSYRGTGGTESLFCMPDTLRYKYGSQDRSEPPRAGNPEDNWRYCEEKVLL